MTTIKKWLILIVLPLMLAGCSPEAKQAAREVWEILPSPDYCECPCVIRSSCRCAGKKDIDNRRG